MARGRFCTDLAALGPYCYELGPIFPSTALALGWRLSARLIPNFRISLPGHLVLAVSLQTKPVTNTFRSFFFLIRNIKSQAGKVSFVSVIHHKNNCASIMSSREFFPYKILIVFVYGCLPLGAWDFNVVRYWTPAVDHGRHHQTDRKSHQPASCWRGITSRVSTIGSPWRSGNIHMP